MKRKPKAKKAKNHLHVLRLKAWQKRRAIDAAARRAITEAFLWTVWEQGTQ